MVKLFAFGLLGALVVFQAAAQDNLEIRSLSQAVKLGLKSNANVLNAQLDVDGERQRSKEILSAGLPQINASGRINDNLIVPTTVIPAEALGGTPGTLTAMVEGVTYNATGYIQAHQLLFDQSFFVGLKAAKVSEQFSRQTLGKTKESIAMQVALAYFNALLSSKQTEFLQKQLENYQSLFKVAAIQFQSGVTKKSDLDRIKVNQTNIATQVESFENITQQQLSDLKLLLGIPNGSLLSIQDSLTDSPLFGKETESVEIQNRFDWKILETQEKLKALDIDHQIAGYMPVLSLNAQYGEDFYGNDFAKFNSDWYRSSYVNLSLDLPLFDGLRKKAQLAESRIEMAKIKNTKMLLVSTANKEIQDERNHLAYSISRIKNQSENRELAKEVYKETSAEYKTGTATLSDLLNAESSLLESQRQYLGALADKLFAELALQKAKGVLLEKLSVN